MSNHPKTICIVSSFFPPHLGGAEKYASNLAKQLAANGHHILVLTCNLAGSCTREVRDDGVEILRIPAAIIRDRFPLPAPTFKNSAAWKELEQTELDAMIVNARFYPLSLHALELGARKGVETIVIEHGSDYLTLGNRFADKVLNTYEHQITKRVVKYHPRFYGVSSRASAWLKTFGVEASGVIPNAIDASAFRAQASAIDFRRELGLAPTTPLAVFTGRLVREKGIYELAQAAARFQGHPSGIQFLIAGDGPERARLEQQAPANLNLLGRIESPDLAALLLQADLFCFASLSEGLPTSLLEAAVCEVYLVTTDVGGVEEIMAGQEHGTVLGAPTAQALTAAIADYLQDPQACEARARSCRAHVEKSLSWEASAQAALNACFPHAAEPTALQGSAAAEQDSTRERSDA